ncbi:DUF1800 family protein [Cryomorphaceae bacterium 1068]|nr:DUF1800 family protein [Cryomorphaceae bacterium 1068]
MKKSQLLRFLPCVIIVTSAFSQKPVYEDFVGAGHSSGINISTSSSLSKPGREQAATGASSLDGSGLESRQMEAARFLAQAGFGGKPHEIKNLATHLNFESWIDRQFAVKPTSMLYENRRAYQTAKELKALTDDVSNYNNSSRHFHYAWWQSVMTNPDQLRQRVAAALSEIIVLSTNGPVNNNGENYASFYDLLLRHAFGNYKDLLYDVTMHPAMGVYLTYLRNPKTDTTSNTFPDENYAREVMQLFSIGLYELNQDGSIKLDENGNSIPTYDNDDIIELSKVFTGLAAGALNKNAIENDRVLRFSTNQNDMDYTVPMLMYEDEHEEGEKYLLNGYVIPSGLSGTEDIEMALTHLVNHPNTGPFICRKLIQNLVKSNPSPAYIADVSAAFNDNGEGIRGDMKAVIKAILLHEEARDCLWQNESTNGKLLAPSLRYTAFARAMQLDAGNNLYYSEGRGFFEDTFHRVLSSPSVFNFYSPDHIPNGPLNEMELVAPEFEIFNSVTSIGYLNQVNKWTDRADVFTAPELTGDVEVNREYYYEMAQDPQVLINHLDLLLTKGRLSETTRNIIIEALEGLPENNQENMLRDRWEIATYLVMISPEFNILK